jgi:hypothetical protein
MAGEKAGQITMVDKKPDLKLVKVPESKRLWKPITPEQMAAYRHNLIYAGYKPRSSYNGWRKDYEC